MAADGGSSTSSPSRHHQQESPPAPLPLMGPDYASAVMQANGWHFKMLRDEDRAMDFDRALRKVVRSGDVVLDVGAGTGLLGLMAWRAGGLVYACEANRSFAAAAQRVLKKNGADFPVIPKSSMRLEVPRDLPRRADVMVAEVLSSSLFGEGILATYRDAHRRLLVPGARVIPSRVRLHFAVVEWPHVHRGNCAGKVAGFDLSAFNTFRAERRLLELPPVDATVRCLTKPCTAVEVDLANPEDPLLAQPARLQQELELPVLADGECQLVVVWWDASLDAEGEVVLSTNPFESLPTFRHGHWGARGQALPMQGQGRAALTVRRGDRLRVRVDLVEDRPDPQPHFEVTLASQ